MPRRTVGRKALRRAGAWVAGLALALGLGAGSARGVSIVNVTLTDLSSSSTAGGAEANDWAVATALSQNCGLSCTAFDARFSAGAGIEGDYFENLTLNVTWSWRLDFAVDALPGEQWALQVDSRLLGALTLVNDSAGSASATLNDVLGVYTGPGATSGSLDLTGFGTLSGAGGGNTGFNLGDRTSSFVVTNGFGAASVSMTFTMTGQLTSSCGGFLACLFGVTGDEPAVRLGEAPVIATYSAGSYPGPDGRAQAEDGHRASVWIWEVPEPSAAALGSAAAFSALAALRRRR
jgi:hypothetical protein